MSNFSTLYRLPRSSRQMMTWVVLISLLSIQVRVAVDGCLIWGYLPSPQQAEQLTPMQMSGDQPCSGRSSQDQQPCMKHCEQSSGTPKFTFDLPFFAPALLLATVALFAVADSTGFEVPTQSPAITGPPPYLRFLRLLN